MRLQQANVVLGNFIGTDARGDNLGNPIGISLARGSNTIGGTSSGAANVIGFSTVAGLEIASATGTTATNNIVIGNLFGTNAGGANLGNVVGVLLQAGNNTIGGTSTGAANVFGFNTSAGLEITGTAATAEVVAGNLFGTNGSGAKVGNVVGVLLQTARTNTIGGTAAGAANIFGFNTSSGLETTGAGATANVILGNSFGTDASGANLGNAVSLNIGSGGNTIGGTTPGAGNVICIRQ